MFGEVDRDPRERVLIVAYFALVRSDQIQLRAGTDSAKKPHGVPVKAMPELAFDHRHIVAMAHERLSLASTKERRIVRVTK